MINYLFGLLSGIIVGLFLNNSLRYVAQLFFLKRVEKTMKRLEAEAVKSLEMMYGLNGPHPNSTSPRSTVNPKVN